MNRLVAVSLVVASFAGVSTATAQQCAGAPPWDFDAFRIGALVTRSSEGSGFGGLLDAGVPLAHSRSVFVEMRVDRMVPADDPRLTAMGGRTNPAYVVNGAVGVELPVAGGKALSLCPSAGLGYTSGPETLVPDASGMPGELEVEQVNLAWTAGAWLGGSVRHGVWRLIPAVGAHLVHDRTTTSREGQQDGVTIEEADTRDAIWMRLSMAAGVTVGPVLSVLPTVRVPVTARGPRATVFAVSVSATLPW